jgi:hypothetical protein
MGTASTLKADTQSLVRNEGVVDLAVEHGLPGNSTTCTAGLSTTSISSSPARAPTASKASSAADCSPVKTTVNSRTHRGVWGLFGSYDYVAPQLFVSRYRDVARQHPQRRLFRSSALQSTLLAGVGYGAGRND